MKKYTIIVIALFICAGITFYLWTAISARQVSDDIMSKFKETERGLDSTNVSMHNQTGASIEQLYQLSSRKSQVIFLIDSLKDDYEKGILKRSKPVEPVVKRLLQNLQQLNKVKQDIAGSQTSDTISYWKDESIFKESKWLSTYFEDIPKEAVITYLNYLRNQAIKLQ